MHESRDSRGAWAEQSIDGWYLGTSQEHYQCHIIHVKKTSCKRIPDTVFVKHKYITQPTLTPVDTVVKAIDDLTHALKGARNVQGMQQIERLEKIDEHLNNIPSNLADTLDPPSATQMNMPTPKVEDITPRPSPPTIQSFPPIEESSETMLEPAARVQNKKETVKIKDKVNANREQLRQNIQHAVTQQARIPQRHQIQL